MKGYTLAPAEEKFAKLIWANGPVASMELVRLAKEEMGWEKSTVFTVLKKLCGRGLFRNERAVVYPVISREEFYARQSRLYVEEAFGGSLPKFVTAFFGGRKLTKEQAEDLKRLIDEHRE